MTKTYIKLFSVVFVLLAIILTAAGVRQIRTLTSKAATAQTPVRITVTPAKIGPEDPYTVNIQIKNGNSYVPYTGALDFDSTYCTLDVSLCRTNTGQWKIPSGDLEAVNGVVSVPGNLHLPEGIFMSRFKPRGMTDDYFSNFDVIMVDSKQTMPQVSYGSQTIREPQPGSYMIFENYDKNNQFAGYTRIDIESDPCPLGGYTMRFTKTRERAYFNTGGNQILRWCLTAKQTPSGSMLSSPGGIQYYPPLSGTTVRPIVDYARKITVTYPNSLPQDAILQGVLGGVYPDATIRTDRYITDPDMYMHYTILPPGNRVPANLSSNPVTIIENAYGHPMHSADPADQAMDLWHMEALAPIADGAVTMRYIEYGFDNRLAHSRWGVTEDWTWRTDGTLTNIRQWVGPPVRCWTPTYRCTNGRPNIEARLIDSYIPDSRPLTLRLRKTGTGTETTDLTINNGGSYDLIVRRPDGKGYSGFLELKRSDGKIEIWTDVNRHPIYVSNGSVTVGPSSYGSLRDFSLSFSARPYFVNSTVNSLAAIPDNLKPNASVQPFSNTVSFAMGSTNTTVQTNTVKPQLRIFSQPKKR